MLVRKTPNMYEREGQRVGAVCCLNVGSRTESFGDVARHLAPLSHLWC